ncbi:GNAT family N-acetyltransferase [Phenylobacterium sp.]|uniref:GNAT family N-acetyltransferase n=1 Tax=Phenylobacterium sp. TaxID=1871053 RepID=UPI0030F3B7D1
MTTISVSNWTDLSAQDLASWRAWQAGSPALASPFLSPGFAQAVDRVRGDLAFAVQRDSAGAAQAILPFHPGYLGSISPLAGPMSDWHGVLAADPDATDLKAMVTRLGASVLRLENGHSPTRGAPGTVEFSHLMDLSGGYSAYEARGQAREAGAFSRLAGRGRKLARNHKVTFDLDDRSPEALDWLIANKRRQCLATGQFDVFSVGWTRALLHELFGVATPELRGRLSTLRIDGDLAAAHFGIQGAGVLHYWFPVYDEAHGACSPGLILLQAMARNLADEGVTAIDLGKGDYRYKREFGDIQRPVYRHAVWGDSVSGALWRSMDGLESGWAALPLGQVAQLPGKVARRADRQLNFYLGDLRAA